MERAAGRLAKADIENASEAIMSTKPFAVACCDRMDRRSGVTARIAERRWRQPLNWHTDEGRQVGTLAGQHITQLHHGSAICTKRVEHYSLAFKILPLHASQHDPISMSEILRRESALGRRTTVFSYHR